MKYKYSKYRVQYVGFHNGFGAVRSTEPELRTYPHEMHFDSAATGSLSRQFPSIHNWLKEEFGEHKDRWFIKPRGVSSNKRVVSFKAKEDAILFKMTFDGIEKNNE